MPKLLFEKESYLVRKAIFEVYKTFRNNHKEHVYHNALLQALSELGFQVIKNPHLPVRFHGKFVGTYVPDIIVNDCIIVELKCTSMLLPEDRQQFWEYLKATDYSLGFLVNFGKSDGVEILRRVYDEARKSNSA